MGSFPNLLLTGTSTWHLQAQDALYICRSNMVNLVLVDSVVYEATLFSVQLYSDTVEMH